MNTALFQPYNQIYQESYYERRFSHKVLCLESYTLDVLTQKGGYTTAHYTDKTIWEVRELQSLGFVEIPWDGV